MALNDIRLVHSLLLMKDMKIHITLSVFVFLSSLASFAFQPYTNHVKEFELNLRALRYEPSIQVSPLKPGAPIEILFSSNRKAQLSLMVSTNTPIEFDVEFTESQCRPESQVTLCRYQTELVFASSAWIWTEHPDPSKIGKPLQQGGSPMTSPSFVISSLSPSNYYKASQKTLKNPSLTCPSFEFLPKSRKKQLKIASIDHDLMFENYFTRTSENQGIKSFIQVDTEFENQSKLVLKSIHSIANSLFNLQNFDPFLTLGSNVSSLTLRSDQGDFCQVTFSSRIISVQAKLIEVIASMQPTHPILWDSVTFKQMGYLAPSRFFGSSENLFLPTQKIYLDEVD